MNVRRSLGVATALCCAAMLGGVAVAQDATFDVKAVSCDDVLAISEEEAAFVVLITYGYLAGKNGEDEQTAAKIEETVTSALAKCDADPEMSLVSALSS